MKVQLTAENAGSVSPGDPVLFHGHTVGRVESEVFDIESKLLIYGIFIAVTLLYQGGMASYYLRRRAMIESYLRECPEWARRIVQELKA